MPQSSSQQTHTIQYTNKLKNNGIIQITGEERAKYLQGQITADINALKDNNAILACHCAGIPQPPTEGSLSKEVLCNRICNI